MVPNDLYLVQLQTYRVSIERPVNFYCWLELAAPLGSEIGRAHV